MQSNGGVMSSEHARRRPIHMIESGPAAGVLAAAAMAREAGLDHVVAFDMGGTTVKACLIENGQPVETSDSEVGGGINTAGRLSRGGGYALRVPAYEIAELGAGGGSIAWLDEGNALRVGPRSAGAVPGPACYARGGIEPTITDANVALGYMNPTAIAGGTVPIDSTAAATALRTLLPRVKLQLADAAYGVHQVANATMARAIRAVTSERGRDPRNCSLIAFGGAGPIHAAELAEGMGIRRVYVPLFPGLFSALGLLLADLRYDQVQSVPGRLDTIDPATVLGHYDTLARRLREEVLSEDLSASDLRFERYIDLRYVKQSSELTLKVPHQITSGELTRTMAAAFHDEHERTYGYRRQNEPVAVVNVRLRAVAQAQSLSFKDLTRDFQRGKANATPEPETYRNAYFGPRAGEFSARVLTRRNLEGRLAGPAILEEFGTTVVVPPGWRAEIDAFGNIVLES
jgi:N-methylhydantoinase A